MDTAAIGDKWRRAFRWVRGTLTFAPIWWDIVVSRKCRTPRQLYAYLRSQGFSDDDILDLAKAAADRTGRWTPGVERLGLLALKRGAPAGQEKEA